MQSYELDLFSDKDLSNTKRVNQIIGQDVKKNFKLILIKRLHPLGRGGGVQPTLAKPYTLFMYYTILVRYRIFIYTILDFNKKIMCWVKKKLQPRELLCFKNPDRNQN